MFVACFAQDNCLQLSCKFARMPVQQKASCHWKLDRALLSPMQQHRSLGEIIHKDTPWRVKQKIIKYRQLSFQDRARSIRLGALTSLPPRVIALEGEGIAWMQMQSVPMSGDQSAAPSLAAIAEGLEKKMWETYCE